MTSLSNTLSNIVENSKKKLEKDKKEFIQTVVKRLKTCIDEGENITEFAAKGFTYCSMIVKFPKKFDGHQKSMMRSIVSEFNDYEGLHASWFESRDYFPYNVK